MLHVVHNHHTKFEGPTLNGINVITMSQVYIATTLALWRAGNQKVLWWAGLWLYDGHTKFHKNQSISVYNLMSVIKSWYW
jgi:hypothetical protein